MPAAMAVEASDRSQDDAGRDNTWTGVAFGYQNRVHWDDKRIEWIQMNQLIIVIASVREEVILVQREAARGLPQRVHQSYQTRQASPQNQPHLKQAHVKPRYCSLARIRINAIA